jgi:hypothetical protein
VTAGSAITTAARKLLFDFQTSWAEMDLSAHVRVLLGGIAGLEIETRYTCRLTI